MKIIRVFGIVVGIHLFALMLIFANPGCSSTSKPVPVAADTVATPAPSAPVVTVPLSGASEPLILTPAPLSFAPGGSAVASVHYSPTRPGTPAASALAAAPIVDVTPATTYTVVGGDSLWTIAKKNHLNVSDLAVANNMKAGAGLRPGQKLIIPGKAGTAAAAAATPGTAAATKTTSAANGAKPTGDAIQHTVKMGEVLSVIAKKYGVKQGDIAVANNLTDPKMIRVGQILVIPGAQSLTAKNSNPAVPTKVGDPTLKLAEPAKPLFVIPSIEQDLDSGLKPASVSDVPVIKVEEVSAPKK